MLEEVRTQRTTVHGVERSFLGSALEALLTKRSHQLCAKLSCSVRFIRFHSLQALDSSACLGLSRQLRCPAQSSQLSVPLFSFQYKGANIQLLDLPGIIEGAAQGWWISVFL